MAPKGPRFWIGRLQGSLSCKERQMSTGSNLGWLCAGAAAGALAVSLLRAAKERFKPGWSACSKNSYTFCMSWLRVQRTATREERAVRFWHAAGQSCSDLKQGRAPLSRWIFGFQIGPVDNFLFSLARALSTVQRARRASFPSRHTPNGCRGPKCRSRTLANIKFYIPPT